MGGSHGGRHCCLRLWGLAMPRPRSRSSVSLPGLRQDPGTHKQGRCDLVRFPGAQVSKTCRQRPCSPSAKGREVLAQRPGRADGEHRGPLSSPLTQQDTHSRRWGHAQERVLGAQSQLLAPLTRGQGPCACSWLHQVGALSHASPLGTTAKDWTKATPPLPLRRPHQAREGSVL